MSAADADGLRDVIDKRLSWASLHWFPVRSRGGIKSPVIAAEIAPEIAKAVLASDWLAARVAEAVEQERAARLALVEEFARELWCVFLLLPNTPSPLGDRLQRRVADLRTLLDDTKATS